MKPPTSLRSVLLTAMIATAAVFPAAVSRSQTPPPAESDSNQTGGAETSTLKFSDPTKPGTLKLIVANGDIRVKGTDSTDVTVRTKLKPDKPMVRKDGLRVLTSSSSYSVNERNNIITLSYGSMLSPSDSGEFEISVPKSTNVIVSNALGGDIDIADVTGDLEINSLNGEVKLSGIGGGALVETMNGQIEANVRQLQDKKPLSLTSMNGQVSITVRADAKATVRLRTHNGAILTDFDEKQLVTKTAALRPDNAGRGDLGIGVAVREGVRVGMEAAREAAIAARDALREANKDRDNDHDVEIPELPFSPVALPPMTGGKIVSGTLNGGGPEIRVTTMNGDVTLRKAQ
jgi:hypothetical protein